jgi:hypothetical protein
MKVKDLIEILQDMDGDALVVTSSQSYSWDCYEEVEVAEPRTLYRNGMIYENEQAIDEMDGKSKITTLVIDRKKKRYG